MIKRIIKWSMGGVGALLSLGILLYVFLIHPDDHRIHPYSLSRSLEKRGAAITRVGRGFDSTFSLTSSQSVAMYKEKLTALQTRYPNVMTVNSTRFRNPFEIFIAVGSYPERVEGRSAVVLFPGDVVTFSPRVTGDHVLEGGFFLWEGAGTLEIQKNHEPSVSYAAEAISIPHDISSFYYRNIHRFLFPDDPVPGGEWKEVRSPLSLEASDTVTLRCKSEAGMCVVSEPTLWAMTGSGKKNFLVILVDTLRHDALDDTAPFLQQWKKMGEDFTHTWAAGNMTTPSTNALLSCQSPSQLGNLAFAYAMSESQKESFYHRQQPSFPGWFTQGGWQTAMIGNISVISDVRGHGLDHGFSQQICQERNAYDTPQITREAIQWIDDHQGKPFFLYLHFHAPHAPYRPPFSDMWATYPGLGAFDSYGSVLKWLYRATVHYTDRYVETVVKALEERGLLENTHILLTADHGESQEVRVYGENEIGPAYEGAFHDHGATLYNDEIRVPLVIRSPERTEGHAYSTFVSGLDIGPTLLERAGLAIPSWCTGISLQSAIESQSEPSGTRVLVTEGFESRAILVQDRWKYIREYVPTEKRLYPPHRYELVAAEVFSEEQLYDIRMDPLERKNLVGNSAQLAVMRKAFRTAFHVRDSYQLVVENPEEKDLEIRDLTGKVLHHSREKRVILQEDHFSHLEPRVTLDGQPLLLYQTAMRLPLHVPPTRLPEESRGEEMLLGMGTKSFAYLQHIEMDSVKERKVSAGGDVEFEKILRQWGYLNEK